MITQGLVDASIDNAVFNGFSEPKPTTALEVANDMVMYCNDFEGLEPEELQSYVEDYVVRHPGFFDKI